MYKILFELDLDKDKESPMKKILVLTDFSLTSIEAIKSAFKLSIQYGGQITIYHNMTEGTRIRINLNEQNKNALYHLENGTQAKLLQEWQKWGEKHDRKITFISSGGKIVDFVLKYCNEQQPDLIVMGSDGKSNRPEKPWGSTTENMVKNIDYPILIIKKAINDLPFNEIVYASSFNKKEEQSFHYYLRLLPPGSTATIHLLCIDTEHFFTQPSALIKEVMDDYQKIALPLKTEKHFYKDYNVRAGIRHFNRALKPDIIVMSNKVKKHIKHVILGNDTVEIAQASQFPVLIINYPD